MAHRSARLRTAERIGTSSLGTGSRGRTLGIPYYGIYHIHTAQDKPALSPDSTKPCQASERSWADPAVHVSSPPQSYSRDRVTARKITSAASTEARQTGSALDIRSTASVPPSPKQQLSAVRGLVVDSALVRFASSGRLGAIPERMPVGDPSRVGFLRV